MRNPNILILTRDEEFAEQVQRASAQLRPRPMNKVCQAMSSAVEVLEQEGPVDVLVAGPGTGTPSGLTRLQSIRSHHPTLSLVLAYGDRPKANFRDIVRTGALDFLLLPVDDAALTATLQRALDMSFQAAVEAGSTNGHRAPRRELGTVFSVASASGGCGKTFYATNLAYFLHDRTRKRTCILDLDLQFGEVAITLRLRPRYSISDILARDEGDQELEEYIEEYTTVDDTGVHILAAPLDPSDADRVEPDDVARVLEALRCRFDYVIVDLPSGLNETVLTALEISDLVHVLATLDVPSLRNLSIFLKTLQQLNLPSENIKLILNKAERDLGVDSQKVAQLFPQGFAMELPYSREVTRSYNMGTPVMALAPRSEVSRFLEAGLTPYLPEGWERAADAGGGSSAPTGLVNRLLRRPLSVGSGG